MAVERLLVRRGARIDVVVHSFMIDSLIGFQEFPNIRRCEQQPAAAGRDLKFA